MNIIDYRDKIQEDFDEYLEYRINGEWARNMYDVLSSVDSETFRKLRENPYHMNEDLTGKLTLLFQMYNMINKYFPIFSVCTKYICDRKWDISGKCSDSTESRGKYRYYDVLHDMFDGIRTSIKTLDLQDENMNIRLFKEFMIGSVVTRVANVHQLNVQRTLGFSVGTPPTFHNFHGNMISTMNLYRPYDSEGIDQSQIAQIHLQHIPNSIYFREFLNNTECTISLNGSQLSHDESVLYVIFLVISDLFRIKKDIPGFSHGDIMNGIRIVRFIRPINKSVYIPSIGQEISVYTDSIPFITNFHRSSVIEHKDNKDYIIPYIQPLFKYSSDKTNDVYDLLNSLISQYYSFSSEDIRYDWSNWKWIMKINGVSVDIKILHSLHSMIGRLTKDNRMKDILESIRKSRPNYSHQWDNPDHIIESMAYLRNIEYNQNDVRLVLMDLEKKFFVYSRIAHYPDLHGFHNVISAYTGIYPINVSSDMKINQNIFKRCMINVISDYINDYMPEIQKVQEEWEEMRYFRDGKLMDIDETIERSCTDIESMTELVIRGEYPGESDNLHDYRVSLEYIKLMEDNIRLFSIVMVVSGYNDIAKRLARNVHRISSELQKSTDASKYQQLYRHITKTQGIF